MNNIQETLFRTIETITQSKVNEIKFDKTIEAIVTSDEKASNGEYQLKYQDIMFTAYSANNTSKFKKNDNVLVLIPDGDMSKRKTIISSNKKEGEAFIDIQQIITDVLSINFVDEDPAFRIELSTFADETVNFKLKKQAMIDEYPRQTMLRIGAEVYTNINEEDLEGDYGIAIDCVMLNDEGERIPHTFKFSKSNVTGNPYQSRGYKSTNIVLLEERLLEIVNARAYSQGFTKGNEDIVFSNITVEYVSVRDQDKSEYTSNIIAPKGTHFRSDVLYPDESLSLVVEFKQKGEILLSDEVDYKWFVLDGEIDTTENPNYHPDGGIGWRWIKPGDFAENLIKGAGTRVLEVFASFVPNFSTFKCVASYKEAQLSSIVTIVDYTEEISVEIDSSNGVSFVDGAGSTVLTCLAKSNNEPIEEGLTYEWSRVTPDGVITMIQKGESNTLNILATNIGIKTVYLCEVSLSNLERPIGTGSITLVNIESGSSQGVVILGGFRTALYDSEGNAPANFVAEGFQFDVYKNGEKVTENIRWKWIIPPASQTMLTMSNPTLDSNGNQTSTDKVLTLGLSKKFDISKSNNLLSIEVEFTSEGNNNKIRGEAPIAITKVGSNGADGSAGKDGIDGNVYVYEIQGGNPVVVYNGDGLLPVPSTLNEFELMFSKNGDITLAKEVDTVVWELQSKSTSLLSFQGKDSSIRTVTTRRSSSGETENPHKVTLVVDSTWDKNKTNNYLSAKITYEGQLFRETYPISIVKNGTAGESGLTINTNPNFYNVETEADGNISADVPVVVNFDIHKGNTKEENYSIVSVGGVPSGMTYTIMSNKKIQFTFKKGSDLPDSGIIEVDLMVDGNTYRQTFSYGKTRNGDSPYLMFLQSTNGLVFKQGDISTVIYAVVMKGSEIVTDSLPEDSFSWKKIDKSGQEVTGWVPTYYNNQKDKIVITPQDVSERATFNCFLTI